MSNFATIGYGDRKGYERTDPAVRELAHAHDASLREPGVVMGIAGPRSRSRHLSSLGGNIVDST
jgi:hypothetical protein